MKYDAFISYNHAADGQLGPAVRDGLHGFARPAFRLRALRVFCDRRSLPASEGLWPSIEAALNASRCLVLLASPGSANSVWVRREVEHWIKNTPKRPLLIVLADGEIAWDDGKGDFNWERTTALPRVLRGWFTDEPSWINLSGSLDLRSPEFLDAIATLSSALQNRDKDELIGEDVRQHRRARRFRRLSWSGLSVLTAVAVVAALIASVQRATALDQRNTALADQLVAEASTIQDTQPGLARQLIAAAHQLKPTPQVESAVISGGQIAQEIHADVSALAYSPGGSLLALARSGRSAVGGQQEVISHVWLYDTATLSLQSEWSLDTKRQISAVAFDSTSRRLAVAHANDVMLWDVSNPRAPVKGSTLTGHQNSVKSLSFSPGGKVLASGSDDGTLRLWDSDSGNVLTQQQIEAADPLRFDVRFPSTGNVLVTMSGQYDSTVRTWDVSDPRAPHKTGAELGGVQRFDISPDGTRLVTRAEDELRVSNVGGGNPVVLPQPKGKIQAEHVAFGARDQVAAVGGDGFVRLWNVAQQPVLAAELPLPDWDSSNADQLTFSPNGNNIAVATPGANAGPRGRGIPGGTVRIWNTADPREPRAIAALTGHAGRVTGLTVSADGRYVASVGGRTLRLWDVADPQNPKPLANQPAEQEVGLAFSPDGTRLATADEKSIRLLDSKNALAPVRQWPGQTTATDVEFSRDGRLFAVVQAFDAINLYETTSQRGSGHPMPVVGWSMAFLPAQRAVVAVGGSKYLELWDVSNPQYSARIAGGSGHTFQIQQVATSVDGAVIASAARDGSVRLWQIEENGQSLQLTQTAAIDDTGDVYDIVLSPNAQRIATLGRDRTIRVYDLNDGEPITALVFHVGNGASSDIRFVGNDKLAVTTQHGAVDIWDLDVSAALRRLCNGVGEPISETQWRRLMPTDLPYRKPCHP
ncbi:TIR domain-containing protein [Nocardia sp. NRRL S-836]|uniref:WD40 domain-containing protein n=1 Tax=Nocardia sp. NRRL S-836 TaxID=1519492 RepID=UPI0006AE85A2|nr:TIR domain-containing protein [Nocardia sp. NRRL S-836]KOV76230.1 hypothetical protein ADL03_43820 [Nocardia sp. NRRL S-836]